jgi:hypothetical protein
MTGDGPRRGASDEDVITVWQAEGVIMERLRIDAETASQYLRLLALRHGRTVGATAAAILADRSSLD